MFEFNTRKGSHIHRTTNLTKLKIYYYFDEYPRAFGSRYPKSTRCLSGKTTLSHVCPECLIDQSNRAQKNRFFYIYKSGLGVQHQGINVDMRFGATSGASCLDRFILTSTSHAIICLGKS